MTTHTTTERQVERLGDVAYRLARIAVCDDGQLGRVRQVQALVEQLIQAGDVLAAPPDSPIGPNTADGSIVRDLIRGWNR